MPRPESLKEALPGLRKLHQFMRPYVRRQRAAVTGAFTALFLGVIMRALEPWPLKFIFDHVILPVSDAGGALLPELSQWHPISLVALASAALILIRCLRAVCLYYEKVGFAMVGTRVMTEVRANLFRHIQGLSMSFHNRARSGDLLIRVMSDLGMLRDTAVTAFMPLLGNLMILILMAALMLWLHWQLALIVLISAPLYWIPTLRFGREIQKVSKVQRKREGKMATGVMEMIGSMQVVQTLSLEDEFAQKFIGEDKKNMKEGVKFRRLLNKLQGVVQLMIGLSTAAVLFYGTYLVLNDELTAGSLLVFMSYLKAATKPLANFTKYSGRLAKASAAGDRVLEVFDVEAEISEQANAIDAPTFIGEVEFSHVDFAHDPGHWILRDINLVVQPGQMVALVGESGVGKSTFVELISRLHDPTSGSVRIDGKDIRQYTLSSLRSQVAFVLQDTLLFGTTIRENIQMGARDATLEAIEHAARIAQAHEFILRQPDGYDTVVGERGVTLSMGQRQRIAIARAILSPAPILILDEVTSGLDDENRVALLDTIDELRTDRTTFMITHDRREAERADIIVCFDDKGCHVE